MPGVLAVGYIMLAVILLSCERERPDGTQDDTAIVRDSDPMSETNRCVNQTHGYAVAYPARWQVHTGELLGECELFDPATITVPPASEIPIDIAIIIGVERVAFDTVASEVLGRRDLSRQPLTVGGRPAMRIDAETTGEGLHDAGIRLRMYAVDLGVATFTATTYDVGDPPFEERQRVLDAMMETVEFGIREPP